MPPEGQSTAKLFFKMHFFPCSQKRFREHGDEAVVGHDRQTQTSRRGVAQAQARRLNANEEQEQGPFK